MQDIDIKIITITAFLKEIRVRWKFVLICITLGFAFGFIVITGRPSEYESKIEFVPIMQDQTPKNINVLKQFSIDIKRQGNDGIDVYTYSEILYSIPFLTSLLNTKIKINNNPDSISVIDYYKNYTKAPWWNTIIKFPSKIISLARNDRKKEHKNPKSLKDIDIYNLSKEQYSLVETLKSAISYQYSEENNVANICVTSQSAEISSCICMAVIKHLEEYIINYKISKIKSELEYVMKLRDITERDYEKAKQSYYDCLDSNYGISSYRHQISIDSLKIKMDQLYQFYQEMVFEYQRLEIKSRQYYPAIIIIDAEFGILKEDITAKIRILFVYICLGFFISCIWIFSLEPILVDRLGIKI